MWTWFKSVSWVLAPSSRDCCDQHGLLVFHSLVVLSQRLLIHLLPCVHVGLISTLRGVWIFYKALSGSSNANLDSITA